MNTNVAKPTKVAIIGASGTYGKGILARAEEIGVERELLVLRRGAPQMTEAARSLAPTVI